MKSIIKLYLDKIIDKINSVKEIRECINKFDYSTDKESIKAMVAEIGRKAKGDYKKRVGEVILPLTNSYNKMVGFIDAVQFYVTKDSSMINLVEALYKVRELGINKEEFDAIKILLDKFVMSYESKDVSIKINKNQKNQNNKKNSLLYDDQFLTCQLSNIKEREEEQFCYVTHFAGELIYLGFYFSPAKLPRVYVDCILVDDKSKCELSNPIKLGDATYCMKTNRTCSLCPILHELDYIDKKTGEPTTITLAEIAYSLLIMIYKLMQEFGAEPEEVVKIKDSVNIRKEYHKQNSSDASDELDMIVLKKKRYKYVIIGGGNKSSSSDSGDKSNRSSPCQHIRKGHYRRYRSGKIIYVKDNIINAGKGSNKIIKV